jgi:hypothetical protein
MGLDGIDGGLNMKNLDFYNAGIDAGIAGMGRAQLTALEYLQSIYRDPLQPDAVRMRAAKEALPYETPKLTAIAVGHLTKEDFQAKLQRAIDRSGVEQVDQIQGPGVVQQVENAKKQSGSNSLRRWGRRW